MAKKPAYPGSPLPKTFDSSNTDPQTGKARKKYAPSRTPPMDKPSPKPISAPKAPSKPKTTPPKAKTDKEKFAEKQNTIPSATKRRLKAAGVE